MLTAVNLGGGYKRAYCATFFNFPCLKISILKCQKNKIENELNMKTRKFEVISALAEFAVEWKEKNSI